MSVCVVDLDVRTRKRISKEGVQGEKRVPFCRGAGGEGCKAGARTLKLKLPGDTAAPQLKPVAVTSEQSMYY